MSQLKKHMKMYKLTYVKVTLLCVHSVIVQYII